MAIHGSGWNDGAQQQRWRQHGQWCLDIAGCSLLACAKALMGAALITVHDNDGCGAEDGALMASLPICCPLSLWQRRQQREQVWAMMTVVAARTTVPWHHWPFLSCSCIAIDCSSVDDGAQQRWGGSRRWYLVTIVGCPLPSPLMGKQSAA
jgi:hypothetical protein